MQERTVFEEKLLDWGGSIKKDERDFRASPAKACPSQTWRKTPALTSAWSIIISALWSRSNCLLRQAGTSRCCCERNSRRRKQTHWFVSKRKENNPQSCSLLVLVFLFFSIHYFTQSTASYGTHYTYSCFRKVSSVGDTQSFNIKFNVNGAMLF